MYKLFGLCITLLILNGIKLTKSDIFTSLIEVEELFDTESVLINYFEVYLLVQKRKMKYFKFKVKEYKKERARQGNEYINKTLFVSNPNNAYFLIKRFTSDWRYLENIISNYNGSSFLENVDYYENIFKFPSVEDLNGAAEGILRIQDFYNIETASIAKGELTGLQYSNEMTSSDCFVLGQHIFQTGNFLQTVSWMDEALNRFYSEPKNKITNIADSDLEILIGLNKWLNNWPNKDSISKKPNKTVEGEKSKKTVEGEKSQSQKSQKIYKMICRGELKPTSSQLRPLRCHYVTNNVPFLKIAPLKRETASISPFIVIYHEVILDNEIEILKELATPLFYRAFVTNDSTGSPLTGSFFIAKRSQIQAAENKFIQNIKRRSEDMTGLNIKVAQHLEVVHYGIGGHYIPHYDFLHTCLEESHEIHAIGNRMATILFYLSDVDHGGATIFPEIQTAIFPKKGAAVFWYNLYASGEVDFRTRHAACPIITGSKWVANSLISEHGQEFTRQCDIIPDHPTDFNELERNDPFMML